MEPLRDHLRSDQDVDFPGAKSAQRLAVSVFAGHRIRIHSPNDCFRKQLRDVRLHLLRAEPGVDQRILAARRTFLGNCGGVAAEMTAQARGRAMKGQSYAAIRTVARLTAGAAKK